MARGLEGRKGCNILGGSWVSPLIGVKNIVTLLISPLITTHEPPSRGCKSITRMTTGTLEVL